MVPTRFRSDMMTLGDGYPHHPLFANVLLLVVVLLTSVTAIVGQEKLRKYDNMIITPEMEEKARRRSERLENPDFLKLEIARANPDLGPASARLEKSYRQASKIIIYVAVTNTLSEPFVVPQIDEFTQYRLELLKDSQLVPYRKRTARLVKEKQEGEILSVISMTQSRLQPNKTRVIQTIDLSDWYEPLAPGSYQLTIRYRPGLVGNWVASPPVTFEVTP